MADKKNLPPNSPTRVLDSVAEDFDEFMFPTNKTTNLYELQQQAYEDLLKAFYSESFTISNSKILIIQDLNKEWYITNKTHISLVDEIKTDPLVQKLRFKDENEEKQRKLKVICTPPEKIPEEKAIPSSVLDDSPVISWGQVSPESLVEEWVSIRMPGGEDTYYRFQIKAYDAEMEMHNLVPCTGLEDINDPCNWIDLRHIPAEDIVWGDKDTGLVPGKHLLKPGGTILHATSTVREKRYIKEVGRSSCGIPIIKRIDKGKSIA